MKKIFAVFLLLLLMLSGCKSDDSTKDSLNETTPQEASVSEPALLDNKEAVGEIGNIWYIPNENIENIEFPEFQVFGDKLLFYTVKYIESSESIDAVYLIKTIDINTGELLAEAEFPFDGYSALKFSGDKIGICDAVNGNVRIVDSSLKEVCEYKIDIEGTEYYLSDDLKSLYVVKWDSGIFKFDLATGDTSEVLENVEEILVRCSSGKEVIFSYTEQNSNDIKYRQLDLESGEISILPIDADITWAESYGDKWIFYSNDRFGEYHLIVPGKPEGIIHQSYSFTMLEPKNHLLSISDETNMTLYDLEGEFISNCTIPSGNGIIYGIPVWSDTYNGYFFIRTDEIGMGELLFWDIEKECQGNNLTIYTFEKTSSGETASPDVYERAENISNKYGVDILIADQCGLDYFDYYSYAVNDTEQINKALDELEKALSAYPEGFFKQIKYDSVEKIQIELVGTLAPVEGMDVASSAIAFVQEHWDYNLLVADIFLITDKDFHHEFAHIIDNYLIWDAMNRYDALFSEEKWLALQPEGFDYAYSYVNMPESVEKFVESGYFISDYSCTYPTEDRATMFEYGVMGEIYEFNTNPGLVSKLQYYSQCIRDCFDTTGWPAVTTWEEIIQ